MLKSKFSAKIDKKFPVVVQKFVTKSRCNKCEKEYSLEVEATANAGRFVVFTGDTICDTKNCGIKIIFADSWTMRNK